MVSDPKAVASTTDAEAIREKQDRLVFTNADQCGRNRWEYASRTSAQHFRG